MTHRLLQAHILDIYVIYLRFRLLTLFNILLLIMLIHFYFNLRENTTIIINFRFVLILGSLGTDVSKKVITYSEFDIHLFCYFFLICIQCTIDAKCRLSLHRKMSAFNLYLCDIIALASKHQTLEYYSVCVLVNWVHSHSIKFCSIWAGLVAQIVSLICN